jgi:RNA chaperone Hfq
MAADESQSPPRRVLGLAPRPAATAPASPQRDAASAPQGKPATVVAGAPPMGLETPATERHSESEGDGPIGGRKKGAGMADSKQNLQDAFLNHVRKTKVPVTIFLINGVKLQGVITWFDSFCVLLRRDGQSQLVYKSAISTIMPAQPINLYDGED